MPPNRSKYGSKSIEQEGRILLAVGAVQSKKILSVNAAAKAFNVPESTLRRRLSGVAFRSEIRPNNHKLTENEEISLKNWIILLDSRGASPRISMVREMADLLLTKRGERIPQKVGENWVTNFIKRQPELRTCFLRRYDYQRAKNEDPKIITEWFTRVEKAISENGIVLEDIYNFDETGFAMGLISTARVVTRSEYYGKKHVLQPGNREWVTAIECISASGWALPPCLIFKGKVHIAGWYDDLPDDWRIEVSPNGWTNDEIGLRWLEKLFIPATKSRLVGKFRLLILDGHGSHLTARFDQICAENDIIPICMPAHSSHLLQPLDVGCFAVLKRTYGLLVDSLMRTNINHVDKLDFLTNYPSARQKAFVSTVIKNAFSGSGLVPFNPAHVLEKLDIRLRTPTPPASQESYFSPKTPVTTHQLKKQASSIKALLKQRSKSPPSPLKQQMEQVFKACEIQLHATELLQLEVSKLRAANEKKIQKRAKSRAQIPRDEGMTGAESQEIIQAHIQATRVHTPSPPPPQIMATAPVLPGQRASRRNPRCGKCRQLGHVSTHCNQ